jgi:hypothetical protein
VIHLAETTEQYRNRINQLKTEIETEPMIKEMRDDIAEGISKTGNRQADIEVRQDTLEDDFVAVQQDANSASPSGAEVVVARAGYTTLDGRLTAKEKDTANQLAQTMSQAEFESWIATLLDGGPSIFMDTLAALKSAYPTGSVGVALVRETNPAKLYVWRLGDWQPFGDYTGIVIKDDTVTVASTTFLTNKLLSDNWFNPENITSGKMIAGQSSDSDAPSYFKSQKMYEGVGGQWTISPVRSYRIFDSNGLGIGFENTNSNTAERTITVPSGGYFEFSGALTNVGITQINRGAVKLPYDKYTKSPEFLDLHLTDEQVKNISNRVSVSVEQAAFVDVIEGSNLFNKSSITENKFVSGQHSTSDLIGFFISERIISTSNQPITIYPVRSYRIFDSNGDAVIQENTENNLTQRTIKVPVGGYFEFSGLISNLDVTQINRGTVKLLYESYIPIKFNIPELALTESQMQTIGDQVSILKVVKAGNVLEVISSENGKKLSLKVSLKARENGLFNFLDTSLDGNVIHSTSDDITPIRTHTTVGANHGYPETRKITKPNHGKVAADLGSQWSDGSTNFTLIQITGDDLVFAPDYILAENETITVASPTVGTVLTHVSGATNTTSITSFIVTNNQLYPSVKNVSQKIKGPDLKTDGAYFCDKLTINESYEIIDYRSLIDWCKSNIGKKYESNLNLIDGLARLSNSYQFHPFGSCMVTSSILFLKTTTIKDCGFLQSNPLSGSVTRFIPDVKVIEGHDFKNGVDLNSYNSNLYVYASDLIDPSFPPIRYIDKRSDVSFSMGYLFDKGSTTPVKRLENTDRFWDLRNTKKSYPIAISDEVGVVGEGDYYTVSGFRKYSLSDNQLTNFSEIEDGEAYYVFIDAHQSLTGVSRQIEANSGSKIEILRQTGLELLNEHVSAEGITFNIKDGYGQAILKITK